LRRSITTSSVQQGFTGMYAVEVSATMVYARAVELGHPRWKPGVKYPYLGPAASNLQIQWNFGKSIYYQFGF
jgi:hypothetical protein